MRLLGLLCLTGIAWCAALDDATRQLSRDIFRELIEINTTDSAGSTTRAAEAMAKRLRDGGFPAADIVVAGPNERKGNLVARLRGNGVRRPVLLIGHLDVVEARRSDWSMDPFQFIEKDGYFYGRGTEDMKDEDAILVTNFLRLRREGYHGNRDLILALTADEEGGKYNGVEWLLKNRRDLVDGEFVLNADSGGVTSRDGKPVNLDLGASEKQYADFELTCRNPGGHSSQPKPDNAIYHLAGALTRLERSPFPIELNPVTRTYFERRAALETGQRRADMNAILRTPPDPGALARLTAEPRYNAKLRTTCVATRLSGGHANNALPQTAQAIVNCRILPGHTPEETRRTLLKVFDDAQVEVKYLGAIGETTPTAPDSKGFTAVLPPPEVMQPLERLAKEMWNISVIPGMMTGASDSIHTQAAGTPSYGVGGVALDENDLRMHGRDERIRVSAFYDGLEFYYRFLKALTEAP